MERQETMILVASLRALAVVGKKKKKKKEKKSSSQE
jgi:hypothetical protein